MKNLLLGTLVGMAAGYALFRYKNDGSLDGLCDELNSFANKTKRDAKNLFEKGKNQAEYVKDEVEYEFENGVEELQKGAEKLDNKM